MGSVTTWKKVWAKMTIKYLKDKKKAQVSKTTKGFQIFHTVVLG